MTASPGAPGLPVHALVLARRVRALVVVTLVHTTVLTVAAWWAGRGVTLPGLGVFAAHVAVALAAALPVRWQFTGDPRGRQRRAVRAMAVSFTILAVYSIVDGVTVALRPALPGEATVGAVLALAGMVALPLLLRAEARRERRLAETGVAPQPARTTVVVLEVVLAVGAAVDLAVGMPGVTVSGPTLSVVVAVLAVREAFGCAS